MVPYAIVEWTQRLTLAFAEHRRRPDDPHIRARCLVYAGFVAHYAQDLCQPLHATIHFDGRAQNGVSPRTGIHRRVDDLLGKTPLVEAEVLADVEPVVFEALMPAVIEELYRSNALVDRVYEMKDDFPPTDGTWRPTPAVLDFARDRLRASAGLTASLYLTAWENSARITLPDWLDRTAPMEASEP